MAVKQNFAICVGLMTEPLCVLIVAFEYSGHTLYLDVHKQTTASAVECRGCSVYCASYLDVPTGKGNPTHGGSLHPVLLSAQIPTCRT